MYGPYISRGHPTGEETVGAWTRMARTDNVPADAEILQVAIEVVGLGSVVYFDDVRVRAKPRLNGGVCEAGAVRYAWIEWPSETGATYCVERSCDAGGVWTNLAAGLPATPPLNTFTNPNALTTRELYRVGVE